ncbi:MAG: DUF3631 domain-containing protein [Chloroflexota bacterium]|nr:DUF3631 domain-containing protein [Chloroflexota bacterium]
MNVSAGKTLLVKCFAGCTQSAVIDALRARELWPSPPRPPAMNGRASKASRNIRRERRWSARLAANGEVVAEHVRVDGGAGGKRMWWQRPDGAKKLPPGVGVSDLALYGAERLGDDARVVVVVEGEKACDALLARGVAAIGTVCGAAGTPGDAALRALLHRDVVLWPDADAVGRAHMVNIAARLRALGVTPRIIDWPDAPAHGDAADFDGTDDAALRALIDAAQPYTPPAVPDGANTLDAVRAFIRRHVVLTPAQLDAIALWIAHTHALEAADATPYLSITSAEKRSGKSRLLEVLALLAARPWYTGRTTAAALVRKIARDAATLLLDESDAAFAGDREYAETLRGILNAGHRRGGAAALCVGQGANIDVQDFPVFGAKVIAGIGKLPDTIADRSILITMKRRRAGETVERFRHRIAVAAAKPLHDDLAAWVAAHIAALRNAEPAIPSALDDRAADGWEPLLAIADAAGGDWPERARAAALALSVGAVRDDDSQGVRLLADVRGVFDAAGTDRQPSGELAAALVAIEDAPWGAFGRRERPLDARALARLLARYGIKPSVIRVGEGTARGYLRSDFEDAFSRYIPMIGAPERNNVTTDSSPVLIESGRERNIGALPEPPVTDDASDKQSSPDSNQGSVTLLRLERGITGADAVADAGDDADERSCTSEVCTICGGPLAAYTAAGEPRCAEHAPGRCAGCGCEAAHGATACAACSRSAQAAGARARGRPTFPCPTCGQVAWSLRIGARWLCDICNPAVRPVEVRP